MIQKLQKLFHTDKWRGKVLFLFVFYVLLFFLGHWIWFLLPIECLDCDISVLSIISPFYFFLILPILSFIFVFIINKKFNFKINRIILFLTNLILVMLNLFLFFIALIYSMQPNFF